jgi:hypothetical protein
MADDLRIDLGKGKRDIQFSTEVIEIIGKSFPYKDKLREMGCKWNPEKKVWYKESKFTDEEKYIIDTMNLKLDEISKINELRFRITDLKSITDEMGSIYCLGIVKNLEKTRIYTKNDGKTGCFQRFLLVDYSSYIQCIFWDNVGHDIIKENMPIFIRNAYSRVREGRNELHCGSRTKINKLVNPELSNEIILGIYNDWIRNTSQEIASLEENEYQQFLGMVTEAFHVRDYLACPICSSGLTEDGLKCSKCDKEVNSVIRFILSIILHDNTNAIKATLFGELVEELLGFSEAEIDKVKKLTMLDRVDSDLVACKISKLIGTKVLLEGKIERNSYTELLEINVNRIIPFSGVGGN